MTSDPGAPDPMAQPAPVAGDPSGITSIAPIRGRPLIGRKERSSDPSVTVVSTSLTSALNAPTSANTSSLLKASAFSTSTSNTLPPTFTGTRNSAKCRRKR